MQRSSGWLRHNCFQCAGYNLGNKRLLYLLVSSANYSVYDILIAWITLTSSTVCKVDRNEAFSDCNFIAGCFFNRMNPFGGSGATENNEMQNLGLWFVIAITKATSSMCSSLCWFLSPPNPPALHHLLATWLCAPVLCLVLIQLSPYSLLYTATYPGFSRKTEVSS